MVECQKKLLNFLKQRFFVISGALETVLSVDFSMLPIREHEHEISILTPIQ